MTKLYATNAPFFVFVFEFKRFRSVRTIAGPGEVIRQSKAKTGGRTTRKKASKKAERDRYADCLKLNINVAYETLHATQNTRHY